MLQGVHPSPGEHRRHALHDALQTHGPLHGQLGVPHPVHQPVEHHEHAVVVLGHRHLVEVAVRLQGEQPALLTQHRPPVLQVPLVGHDHNGTFVPVGIVFGGADGVDQPAHCVETGPVADAVDQNVAVGPLELLLHGRRLLERILSNQTQDFHLHLQAAAWISQIRSADTSETGVELFYSKICLQ